MGKKIPPIYFATVTRPLGCSGRHYEAIAESRYDAAALLFDRHPDATEVRTECAYWTGDDYRPNGMDMQWTTRDQHKG